MSNIIDKDGGIAIIIAKLYLMANSKKTMAFANSDNHIYKILIILQFTQLDLIMLTQKQENLQHWMARLNVIQKAKK